jgi:hypothetical protein
MVSPLALTGTMGSERGYVRAADSRSDCRRRMPHFRIMPARLLTVNAPRLKPNR